MTTLYESVSDSLKRVNKIIEHNGHKFKISIYHRNGDPIGFNTNCCLSIMDGDGVWKHLEDSCSLNIKWENLYYMTGGDYHIENQNKLAEKEFINYITKVY